VPEFPESRGSEFSEPTEEIGRPANVIFIEMRERHGIVVVPLRLLQIGSQFLRQVNPNVEFVISATSCCVIEENLLSGFSIDSATIGVPEREERHLVHTANPPLEKLG
jgi:hypothetical protein